MDIISHTLTNHRKLSQAFAKFRLKSSSENFNCEPSRRYDIAPLRIQILFRHNSLLQQQGLKLSLTKIIACTQELCYEISFVFLWNCSPICCALVRICQILLAFAPIGINIFIFLSSRLAANRGNDMLHWILHHTISP